MVLGSSGIGIQTAQLGDHGVFDRGAEYHSRGTTGLGNGHVGFTGKEEDTVSDKLKLAGI